MSWQWGLWRESGTAATVAVVGCSLNRGFYCLASGASVADLATNVKQIPVFISIVSCVPFFMCIFISLCVGHGVDIVFCSSWYRPCSVAQ